MKAYVSYDALSGGIAPVAVSREGLLGAAEQHRRRRDVVAPRRLPRADAPSRGAERADGRGHRAHQLVEPSAHERAQALSTRGVSACWSEHGHARIPVAVGRDVASEQRRGRSKSRAYRSVDHGAPRRLTDAVDIELSEDPREGGPAVARRGH